MGSCGPGSFCLRWDLPSPPGPARRWAGRPMAGTPGLQPAPPPRPGTALDVPSSLTCRRRRAAARCCSIEGRALDPSNAATQPARHPGQDHACPIKKGAVVNHGRSRARLHSCRPGWSDRRRCRTPRQLSQLSTERAGYQGPRRLHLEQRPVRAGQQAFDRHICGGLRSHVPVHESRWPDRGACSELDDLRASAGQDRLSTSKRIFGRRVHFAETACSQARDREYPAWPFVVEAVLRCRASPAPRRGTSSGSGRRRPPPRLPGWASQVARESAGAG